MDDWGIADILQDQKEIEDGELCPIVEIPWDNYKQSWQNWWWALVIRVLGKSLSFKILELWIQRTWQLEHGCEVTDIDKEHMVARFYSQVDYMKVLNGGPWTVLGHYLMISKWRPNLTPSRDDVQSTLVWIRFPTLPLELFNDNHLLRIGNRVGRAIKVDRNMVDSNQGKYARVCVEISLN